MLDLEDTTLEAAEVRHIRQILEACDQNRSRAATMLGIHRTTLIKKIKKYGLD